MTPQGNTSSGREDLRLIEDYLPIVAISKEASREKSVRKVRISALHLCGGAAAARGLSLAEPGGQG